MILLIQKVNINSSQFIHITKGEEFCPSEDITHKIRQEMLDSDAVIFSDSFIKFYFY